MATFDPNEFFNKRAALANTDKSRDLEAASAEKVAILEQGAREAAVREAQQAALAEADRNSWVNQMGLQDTVVGDAVNLFARYTSGSARMGGNAVTGVLDTVSFLQAAGLNQEDHDAFNRHAAGKATPADMERLNRKHVQQLPFMPGDIPETMEMTTLDLFKQAAGARDISRKVTKAADLSSIVDHSKTNQMSRELAAESRDDLSLVTGAFDGDKDLHERSVGMVKGLAGLIATGAGVVGNNPGALLEYVTENAPQLLVGAAGAGGKAVMSMSNIGYATQEYQKGIEKYQAENNGALPPEDQRQYMATMAASLALAEQVGDVAGLGLGKFGKAAAEAGEEVAKISIKQGLVNTAKAGLTGTATEAATEGWQTYAEGEANGTPATAEQIYEGMVIGGAVGGSLTSGGRLVAEMAQATPEHAEQKAAAETKQADFRAAVEAGDPSVYANPESPDFDRAKAVGVLFAHSQREDVAPEVRAQNLEQAGNIVAEMESERADLESELALASTGVDSRAQAQLEQVQAELANTDPQDTARIEQLNELASVLEESVVPVEPDTKKAKSIQLKLNKLDRQLNDAQTLHDELALQLKPKVDTAEFNTMVEQANAPVPETSRAAADSLIVLSMASPEKLQPETAQQLATNKNNGLTPEQRDYLRVFSEARLAQNALRDMNAVSQEILYGSPKGKGSNLGIAQYRHRLSAAISAGNAKAANRSVEMISSFAATHQSKLAAARKAGMGGQILFNQETKQWMAYPPKTFKDSKVNSNGGLTINSVGLVQNIAKEVAALTKTAAEMKKAVEIKFGKGVLTQDKPGVQSVPPANTTSGSPASLFREMREREGRVDGMESEDSNPTPSKTVSPSKSKEKPVVFGDEATARNYIRDKKLAATHRVKNTGRDQYSVVPKEEGKQDWRTKRDEQEARLAAALGSGDIASPASPASVPASPSLADARGATAPSSAPAAETVKEETQPVAAQQPDERSESPAAEAATAAGNETDQGKLVVMGKRTPKGESKAYKARNLVADYFTQDAGKEGGSKRPLASVRGFLSQVKADATKAGEYLKSELTEAQGTAIEKFVATAEAWQGRIKSNLAKGNLGYEYEDMMQFFLDEGMDIEENVKTALAYAAYGWVAENATKLDFNDHAEINAILLRDENHVVSRLEENKLGPIGTRQSVIVNALGQRVVAALGLKAERNAPRNLLPQLEATMGIHAMKLLMDEGILQRTTVSGKDMAALTGSKDTSKTAQFQFVKLDREHAGTKQIHEALKGSQGVLDKLFSVESGLKDPAFEPIPYKQKTTRNTSQKVPKELAKVLEKANAEPSYIRQDMLNLLDQVSPETMLEIAGFEDVSQTSHHVAHRFGAQAKNDGLRRDLQRFSDFVQTMAGNLELPLFFDHTAWKQQRVGISTNSVNPQTSKLHRHMLYRASWETTVELADATAMENFRLRVAEGLGIKTDKQSNEQSIEAYKAKLAKTEIKAAVNVLRKSITEGGQLSENEQAILKAGVKEAGEGMHSLDALMALAHYGEAVANKQASFKVQMMSEVDGVTNGPMLSHLLLGAGDSVEALYALLNRGGFYEAGSQFDSYNLWRGAEGHLDLYEITALHMTQAVRAAGIDQKTLGALYAFTGKLSDDAGNVAKAGRNIIKTPLTAMVFGSSVPSAVESMADNFVDSIYSAIEDTANGAKDSMTLDQLKSQLKVLGVAVAPNVTISELMEREFNAGEVAKLKAVFKDTLGKAVKTTMEQDFSVFIEQRRQFNLTAQTAFELYNAAYTGMREQMLADLVAKGEIEVNPTTGERLHDLTVAQEAELREKLKALEPVAHTAMSKMGGEIEAGLYVSKSGRKLSTDAAYKATVKFSTPFSDNGAKSTTAHGYEIAETNPGVAMAVMLVHSTDSAISHAAAKLLEVLNIHDAHGAGLAIIQEAARNLNQATWNVTLNYSPAAEITETLLRTVRGLDGLLKAGNVPDAVLKNLAKSLVQLAEKHEMNPQSVLHMLALDAKAMAHAADDTKLAVQEKLGAVNQYAMEGAAYLLTDEDRAAAAALRAELTSELSAEDKAALESVAGLLDKAIKEAMGMKMDKAIDLEMDPKPAQSLFGEIGSPVIQSDMELVALFKDGVVTADKLMDSMRSMLAKTENAQFSQRLLLLLSKTVSPGMEVRLVTPETKEADVLGKSPKSRGWYVSKEGKEAVYLLSPEFMDSGLTMETLLHELAHAALARTVQNAKGSTLELVNELEQLRSLALAYVEQNKLAQFKPMLANVHELISWGMTNAEFQNRVLNNISMKSKTSGNKLVSGMKAFIDTIVKLLYPAANEDFSNGMTVLVSNVAGLFHQSAKKQVDADILLAQQTINTINSYSTLDIYAALDSHNGRRVSGEFDAHLRTLLTGLTSKLHGPFDSFKNTLLENQAVSEIDVYTKAEASGVLPFASESLAAGFAFTEQEAFVLEQVEATVRAALEGNEGQTSVAQRELQRLYTEVSGMLKVEDFHAGDWSKATTAEKAEAQALHDFVFKLEQDGDKRSDYLSRFAALGMAHEGFNKLLQVATARNTRSAGAGSFGERLSAIVEKVLGWFAGRLTDTFDGQQADHKLTSLVEQLVDIEAKKRRSLIKKAGLLDPVEGAIVSMSEAARAKLVKFGRSDFFKKSGSEIVKASGSVLSVVAGERAEHLLDNIDRMRDEATSKQQGPFISLINEARGAHDGNVVFHFLLRMAKRLEGLRKDLITNTGKVVLDSFAEQGEYLSNDHKAAISAVFLRTDMASLLDHYSMAEIQAMMLDRSKLDTAIAGMEAQLKTKFSRFYKNSAKALGYKMATGKVTTHNLLFNAGNIARLYGTQYRNQITESEAAGFEAIIDPLVSLYALSYTGSDKLAQAQEVLAREMARTDGGNGIEMVLKSHKQLQAKSRELLFKGSESLFMKGYTPELYNPYLEVVVANKEQGELLRKQGYSKGAVVGHDKTDPNAEFKRIYTLRDGGLKPHLTGTLSYTGMRAKGTRTHNGNVSLLSSAGIINASNMASIASAKQPEINRLFKDPNFDPTQVTDDHMAPVLNANGDVVNYRYMMRESTKDSMLERDNRPEKILGAMAGSIFDKASSAEQNRKVIQALHSQYKLDYAERPKAHLDVGPNSPDPQLREIWRLMPEHTKQAVRDIWGSEGMKVRSDLIDINFGYRKLSAADAFEKARAERNMVEQFIVMVAEAVWDGKAPLRVRQIEEVWQALVQWTKSNLVVKSFSTLVGNFRSNVSQLLLMGISPADIIKHHRVALKGALAYRKDSAELFALKHQLGTGYVTGNVDEMKKRIVMLEDSIARNPVRPLIEAGLMPTIVEDVAADDDIHSFKSRVTRNVEKVTDKLNPNVVEAGKFVLMTADSTPFKTLSYATQISDFLARYTLYQAKTTGKEPMSREDAIQLASDAFVNYDIPTHRTVQYLNDTGFLMFTKYYIRIQKMILRLYRDNPARTMLLVGLEQYLGDQPTVLDSSMLQHIGNPFSMGALNYPSSLDDLATVKLITEPFK